MIIKYSISNPALENTQDERISKKAWLYICDVVSFTVYEAVDGTFQVRKIIEVVDKRGEHDIFYVTDTAYVMSDEGKTVEVICPYREPTEIPQKK